MGLQFEIPVKLRFMVRPPGLCAGPVTVAPCEGLPCNYQSSMSRASLRSASRN